MAVPDMFTDELQAQLDQAAQGGRSFVLINSWELHAAAGGPSGVDHAMPVCRVAMRNEMQMGDVMLVETGAGLSIRYLLPRTPHAPRP
jgi:hypothetical protein